LRSRTPTIVGRVQRGRAWVPRGAPVSDAPPGSPSVSSHRRRAVSLFRGRRAASGARAPHRSAALRSLGTRRSTSPISVTTVLSGEDWPRLRRSSWMARARSRETLLVGAGSSARNTPDLSDSVNVGVRGRPTTQGGARWPR
jgi:hypothetical protein